MCVRPVVGLIHDDAMFDVAVAGNVLHLLDDPHAAVAELRRVAKPDGIIAIPNYVNAEATDERFLKSIEAVGFSAKCEWYQAGFLVFF